MLFLPELRLYKVINALFYYLKEDLKESIENNLENESFLYLLFHEDADDKTKSEYYRQAKEIFLRTEDNPRFLQVFPVFDKMRRTFPSIYITIPGDNEEFVQLGDEEGGVYSYTDLETKEKNIEADKLEKGYNINLGIVTVSDNILETVIINYVLRALLIASTPTLEEFAFLTPKFSVQDLNVDNQSMPANCYTKGLMMNCLYQESTPTLYKTKLMDVAFKIEKILY